MAYQEVTILLLSDNAELDISIEVDKAKLKSIDSELDKILSVEEGSSEIVYRNLEELLQEGLITDATCKKLDISSVEDLEQKIDEVTIENQR